MSTARDIEPERFAAIWRHACDLTQDATPLIKSMLTNDRLDGVSRAQLIAPTLLDDVTAARVVIRESLEFIAQVVGLYSTKVSLVHTEADECRWLLEARWIAEPESKSREVKRIAELLRTLISGVVIATRETLSDILRDRGGRIGEAIAGQARIGGSIAESIDIESGTIRLSRDSLPTS
jgi:hypothetical protein